MKRSRIFLGIILILLGFIVFVIVLLARPALKTNPATFGVSFSVPHAKGIGLDWQETYNAMLDDLGVKHLRLSAYWEEIEPTDDVFDFADLDYQIEKAEAAGAQVVLSVGRKLPRWPECHVPEWARELPEEAMQQEVLSMLPVVVNRYKDNETVVMWQLENEPLLDFGHCPAADLDFLAQEQYIVKSLSAKPILVTDSGELNSWIPAAAFGDVLGTTMYRTVYSGRTNKPFHYDYIFPSWMYRLKARLVGVIRHKPVLISELQGEPWTEKPWTEATVEQRREVLSPERLVELARFAERTQLTPAYWWGVEYWYWEKVVNGEDVFWETARNFF